MPVGKLRFLFCSIMYGNLFLKKTENRILLYSFFSRIVYNQGVKHKFQNTCMEIIKEILGGASWEY